MRRQNRFVVGFTVVLAGMLVSLPGSSLAKSKGGQYAVEFACGSNDGSAAGVLPGDYATVVSVLNTGTDTRARAHVVLTFPRSRQSDLVGTSFEAGQARQLDCADLLGGLFGFPETLPSEGFYQGFVTIEAETPLNVVTRYTTSSDGQTSSQVVTAQGKGFNMPRPRRGDRRVDMCHIPPGNPDNAHTISIDDSSASAHLRHGDHRGECEHHRD